MDSRKMVNFRPSYFFKLYLKKKKTEFRYNFSWQQKILHVIENPTNFSANSLIWKTNLLVLLSDSNTFLIFFLSLVLTLHTSQYPTFSLVSFLHVASRAKLISFSLLFSPSRAKLISFFLLSPLLFISFPIFPHIFISPLTLPKHTQQQ